MTNPPGPPPPGDGPAPRGLGVPPVEATARGRSVRRWLIPALVLVPIVAAVAAYLVFFTGDSPDELTLSTPQDQPAAPSGSPTTAAATTGGLAGQWTVGTGSVAGYRVREKLVRLPSQSDGVGRTGAVTGSVAVADDGGRLTVQSVRMEVDVSQLKSDEPMRDNRMRTMGLETAKFPRATFASTGPMVVPGTVAQGQRTTVDATGDLTIHGVTRKVTIPLQVQMSGARAEVVGSLTFPMSDFGITPPSIANVVTVEPDATLEFQLFLSRA